MEEALRTAAQKADCLGSRREIAEWITRSFATELDARRGAIRIVSSRGHESTPSNSGFRMMPTVGVLSPDGEGTPSAPVTPAAPAPSAPASSRTPLLIAAGALLLGVGGLVTWSMMRTPTAAAATTPTVTATATAEPLAAPPATTPPTVAVAATATATQAASPTTTAPHYVGVRSPPAFIAPQPTATASTKPADPTATVQKPWDKDSPLPPP